MDVEAPVVRHGDDLFAALVVGDAPYLVGAREEEGEEEEGGESAWRMSESYLILVIVKGVQALLGGNVPHAHGAVR